MTNKGIIKYVNPAKDFGFITPDEKGPDVFFSFQQLRGNAARLPQKGESVVYDAAIGKRGSIATTVYNMADPLAVEDHACDTEAHARFEALKQARHEGRKAFTADLIEKNRQWREARSNR